MISGIRRDMLRTVDHNNRMKDKISAINKTKESNPFRLPDEFKDVERLAKMDPNKFDTSRFLSHRTKNNNNLADCL